MRGFGSEAIYGFTWPRPPHFPATVDNNRLFWNCFRSFRADFEDNSQPSISPMGILSESPVPSASKWFEENLNDFSLSSFLGHLESNCDGRRSRSRSPNRVVSCPFSNDQNGCVDTASNMISGEFLHWMIA